MNENNIITCEVVGFQEYGVFVRCDEYDGLVHISEISEQYVENIEEIFKVGDLVKLLVLDVNEEDKKLKLSYKKCHKIHKR
ncbi:MAG TPA: S1 RNA-binding domain-containing protein, partial [Acholeplasma sp.]|nr:S1 RNA-binding domain-containing protein [Acholeplasma sp.]